MYTKRIQAITTDKDIEKKDRGLFNLVKAKYAELFKALKAEGFKVKNDENEWIIVTIGSQKILCTWDLAEFGPYGKKRPYFMEWLKGKTRDKNKISSFATQQSLINALKRFASKMKGK